MVFHPGAGLDSPGVAGKQFSTSLWSWACRRARTVPALFFERSAAESRRIDGVSSRQARTV